MRPDARLRRIIDKLHKNPVHRLALRAINDYMPSIRRSFSLFEEDILAHRYEMTRNQPRGQIYFDSYPRSAMNPREIKVAFDEIDRQTEGKGFSICYMLHADDLRPDRGTEYTLRVMAWCESSAARKRARRFSGLVKDRNPVRQWSKWESLWVGDKYKLHDLGPKDAENLAQLVTSALTESYGRLRRALN